MYNQKVCLNIRVCEGTYNVHLDC